MIVRTRSVYLPPIAGWLVALRVDHCEGGFSHGGVWRDCWPGAGARPVRTLGVDLGLARVRVVLELAPESHRKPSVQASMPERL